MTMQLLAPCLSRGVSKQGDSIAGLQPNAAWLRNFETRHHWPVARGNRLNVDVKDVTCCVSVQHTRSLILNHAALGLQPASGSCLWAEGKIWQSSHMSSARFICTSTGTPFMTGRCYTARSNCMSKISFETGAATHGEVL